MMLVALTLAACGAGSEAPATPGTGVSDAPPEPMPQAPEDPGTKLEQCERLGALIEKTETGTNIVNVNDRSKMDELAERRRAAADEAAALPLGEVALIALRDRYVDLCRRMADALEGVASPDAEARATAVQQHEALDTDVTALVDDLNATCGAS